MALYGKFLQSFSVFHYYHSTLFGPPAGVVLWSYAYHCVRVSVRMSIIVFFSDCVLAFLLKFYTRKSKWIFKWSQNESKTEGFFLLCAGISLKRETLQFSVFLCKTYRKIMVHRLKAKMLFSNQIAGFSYFNIFESKHFVFFCNEIFTN